MSKLPPGPRFAPIQTIRFVRDIDRTFQDAARRFGDPFSLPTLFGDLVVTGEPDGIKEIYTAEPDTFEAFGSGPLEPVLGKNSMLLISGARHKRERKLLMPPFHGDRMRRYGKIMEEATIARTEELSPGRRVTMQSLTQTIAFDVILRAVFGVEDPARVERFHEINAGVFESLDPVYMFFPQLQRPVLPRWRRFLDMNETMRDLLQLQIDERRRAGGEHEDILSLMLAARDDAGQPMTDEELRDELLTMIAAGHETTALSMAWTMFWIHRERRILDRLLAEIDELGPDPSPDALAKLPYLSAVCDETMRLRPVVSISPRHTIAPFKLRGWDLPVGTAVAASIGLAHQNPTTYPDPGTFRPERFLERKFTPFEFIPFGGGSRRCLGAAFAGYEMRIVLATLLSRYRFSLVSTQVPRVVRRNVTIAPDGGIEMFYGGPRERTELRKVANG